MKKLQMFFTLLIIVFAGCSNNSKMTYDEARGIVQKKYNMKIDTILTAEINGRGYIVSILNENNENYGSKLNSVALLSNFAGNWQEEFSSKQDGFEGELPEIKNVTLSEINKEYYVYYEEEDGDAFGNAGGGYMNFSLLRISDHKIFTVGYSGFYPYKEMNEIENQLKTHPELLAYIEKKISESPAVYKSSEKDTKYNLDSPENCIAKWEFDNKNMFIDKKIRLTFYDQNLFEIYSKNSSENGKIENDSYKIVSYFRATLIGYNKVTKKYFVIYNNPMPSAEILDSFDFEVKNKLVFCSDLCYSFNFDTNTIEEIQR